MPDASLPDASVPSAVDGGAFSDGYAPDAASATDATNADAAGQTDAGAAGDANTDGAADSAPAPLSAPPFDWVGIIGTGQSLSIGWTAGIISPTQPFSNIKLVDNGPAPQYPLSDDAGTAEWAITPLTEPIRPQPLAGYSAIGYPNDIFGETPHSGMANTLSQVWSERGGTGDYITAHSVVGFSGQCLSVLDKEGGGTAYPGSLNETGIFAGFAKSAGKTYGIGGIVLTHGECDASNGGYGEGLFKFYVDYDTDLKAITGQTSDIVLLASQQSTTPATSIEDSSAVQLWQAGLVHSQQIVCTGPKYQYAYQSDFLHLPAPGYERLGQKYAEVFDLIVNQRVPWSPLQPTSATLSGADLTVTFHVPTPPLNWASQLPLPHQQANEAWISGRGFEVVDSAGTQISILGAEIQGSSVVLTLWNSPPPVPPLTVRYAITQDGTGFQGGTGQGMIGQLRDSDDFVGYDAETLSVGVTTGSNIVTSSSSGAFVRRAGWDDVSGPGLSAGTVVVPPLSDDSLTLSNPWTGDSGVAPLSFHHDERNYAVHFSMPVAPAASFSLWPYYNNVGISDDGTGAADFDGKGFSYSTEALADAGVTPGAAVTVGAITYYWPDEPSGLLDNVEADGQSLVLAGPSSKTTLGLLGSATNSDASGAQGTLTVQYADHTTQAIPIAFTDWTRGGSSQPFPLAPGNVLAFTGAYRDNGTVNDATATFVYALSVSLTSTSPVSAVILPANVTNGKIHIFDIELE